MRLGYASNRAAQHLRGSSSQSLGVHFFPNSQGRNFYMDFVFGAMEHAADMSFDLTLLTENHRDPRPRSLWADGMLVLDPAPNDPFIEQISHTGTPIIAVGSISPEQRDLVRGQFSGGQDRFTPLVLERLRDEGVRRTAIIALHEEFEPLWAAEALQIYRSWCAAEKVRPLVLRPGFWPSPEEIDSMIDTLLEPGDIDGVLVVQQGIAGPLARRYLERLGWSPWVAALAADPATERGLERLMAVDLAGRTYGSKAAQFLTEVINSEDLEFKWRMNHDVRLIIQGRPSELLLPGG